MKKFILGLCLLFFTLNLYADNSSMIEQMATHEIIAKKTEGCLKGVAEDCSILGLYYDGSISNKTIKKDLKKALMAYQKGCDLNSGTACYELGKIYLTDEEYKEAKRAFKKACDDKVYEACYNLASLYKEGIGTEVNYKKSRELYKTTCDNGIPDGCIALGIIYYDGTGVRQNKHTTKEYFDKACDLGYEKGCEYYNKLNEELGDNTDLDEGGMPRSIDYFFQKGMEIEIIGLTKPDYITLKLIDSNTTISGHFSGIKYETLNAWTKTKKKQLLLKYTNKDGVVIYNTEDKINFNLIGFIEEHPIDIVEDNCIETFFMGYGMANCEVITLEAWDAELNRAYKALGGNKNTTLQEAQLAWIKYRDAQETLLRKEYGSRDGTVWQLIILKELADITKTQANSLKAMMSE